MQVKLAIQSLVELGALLELLRGGEGELYFEVVVGGVEFTIHILGFLFFLVHPEFLDAANGATNYSIPDSSLILLGISQWQWEVWNLIPTKRKFSFRCREDCDKDELKQNTRHSHFQRSVCVANINAGYTIFRHLPICLVSRGNVRCYNNCR